MQARTELKERKSLMTKNKRTTKSENPAKNNLVQGKQAGSQKKSKKSPIKFTAGKREAKDGAGRKPYT
ncbi:MAG: hypothetical protein U5R49_12155 [Deltaproteobacteria bacterium]|nr:hypothetical protein [Deltaproteobacteria bacterium]